MQRLPEGTGVNKLKSKRRDLQRILKKPGLSAEKKSEVERALKVLAGDLEQAMKRNQTKKTAQKYHMVKFFERKKALRALKKKAEARELADYYYITEFPKDKKYIALYVDSSNARESQLYKEILKKAKKGELKVPEEPKKTKGTEVEANKRKSEASGSAAKKQKADEIDSQGEESGSEDSSSGQSESESNSDSEHSSSSSDSSSE